MSALTTFSSPQILLMAFLIGIYGTQGKEGDLGQTCSHSTSWEDSQERVSSMKAPALQLKSATSHFQECLSKSPVTSSTPLGHPASRMFQHPSPAEISPPAACLIPGYLKCS